jgi:hypothetical protein
MPLYINRLRRVRHADPHCRAIRASEDGLAERHVDQPVRPPARVVEISDPTDPAELQAIRDFTYPCVYCVPGARESWKSLPIVFEHKDERDPDMDWTYAAVVIRNEPSRSYAGRVQVVGRSGDGRELIIEEASPEGYVIGDLVATGPWDDDEDQSPMRRSDTRPD